MTTHSSFLPGIFHRQKSLKGYIPWSHKEANMTENTLHGENPTNQKKKKKIPLELISDFSNIVVAYLHLSV